MNAGKPDRELDERLTRLAGDITDELGVDWDGEVAHDSAAGGQVAGLRLVAEVATAHRRLRVVPPAVPALFEWGPLRVLERLGAGGFGEVYRAWDAKLQREVALKLAREGVGGPLDSARRWLDEARKLARVRHPHVLAVYGADVHDGRAGIWTDLIAGRTLDQLLREQGKLGAREAALIGIDLCAALSAVHAAGLVHGDVKAQNVMREDGGRLVLMDFGSVRDRGDAPLPTGTPLSTAPEVLQGEPPSSRTDVYSLGALLYRLVSGEHPVPAQSLDELRRKHAQGERRPLRELRPDLPASFIAIVERALSASPDERPASAAEMERTLASLLDGGLARDTATRAPGPGRAWRRAAPAALAALAVLSLLAVILAPRWIARTRPAPIDQIANMPLATTRATLVRVTRGAVEPLSDGGTVHPGEHLALEFQTDRPMHVYVLNEDDQGNAFVLFPVPRLDVANPLPGGALHRLPGRVAGESIDWVVTSAGGRERFLVVASREPLRPLERQLAGVRTSSPDHPIEYPQLSDETLSDLRGIGGTRPTAEAPAGTLLGEIAAALAAVPGQSGGVWVQRVELVNPGR
jgi:hypothetical protein